MRPQPDSDCLVASAKSIGFDLCGIFPANELTVPAHRDEWLARGYAGQMNYLRDERRANPLAALPEARSVIVCAVNYNTAQPNSTEAAAAASAGDECRAWISRYAWGDDYHTVIGEMLERLVVAIQKQFPADNFSARAYVDTGPISERLAARHAGFGWLAKNTCLINEDLGSWLFLGVILTSLELAPVPARAETSDAPVPPPDLCGNCTLCLDACPTNALAEPYVLDASRCISYLTIELRGSVPESLRPAMGWQVFGCDICQDVCPWNRRAPDTQIAAFTPRENRVAPTLDWLLSLSEDDFRRVFKNSPVRRAKWRGLLRSACIAAGNAKNSASATRLRSRFAELANSSDLLVAEHARWALARIDTASSPPAAPSLPPIG
jgi:epoxyqueuosine reductase